MTPDQKLKAIEKRLKAATQGPWRTEQNEYYSGTIIPELTVYIEGCVGAPDFYHEEDAEFIAHAPEDIGWLLERIKRLESGLKRIGDAEWTYQNGATAAGEFQAIANVTLEDCA